MSNESDLQFASLISDYKAVSAENAELRDKLSSAEGVLLDLRDTLRALASGVAGAASDATDAWAAI